jgi:outer membrane protein insertion porin family
LILSAGINQTNFLGTGKQLNLDINTSKSFRTLSVAYTDPYFTDEGISRTFDAYTRLYNAAALGLGDYTLRSNGIGLRFGIPYTNIDRVSFGLAYEQNKLIIGDTAPALYAKAKEDSGDGVTAAILTRVNWLRDTRDSAFAPTQGTFISAGAEVTLPVAEQRYARLTYNHQYYYPISKGVTLLLNGDVGFGKGLGSSPYPVFKNFYAGGIGTVRGFQYGSLGGYDNVLIKDNLTGNTISSTDTPLGGQTRVIANAELAFPLPGTGGDRNLRTFFFADIGQVFRTQQTVLPPKINVPKIINGTTTQVDAIYSTAFGSNVLRSSIGFGISWISPVGPLKLSIAYPTKKDPTDRLQRFQFQVGTGF